MFVRGFAALKYDKYRSLVYWTIYIHLNMHTLSLVTWVGLWHVSMDMNRGTPPPGKSQVAIGFLINCCTDPLEQQLHPWVQLLGTSYSEIH